MLSIKLFLLATILLTSSFTVFSQTEDWRQYSFSMAGVKVKYPSDWRANEEGYERVLHVRFISPGVRDYDVTQSSSIGICSQPKGHLSASSNSRSRCSQRDDHLNEGAKNKVVSEETVDINGIKIRKKITEDKYRPDATFIYAFFSTKDRDILISGSFPRRFSLDKYIPVFDQMLSTLQLLEKNVILTYRNEKYNFSISYPSSWRSCPLDDYYTKKENILFLAPEAKGCLGGNFVSVSSVLEFSNLTKLPDIREILRKQNYAEISPNSELSGLQTVSGEKTESKYLYRQRYFYTTKSATDSLLKISEMYDKEHGNFEQQAREILATVKKF